MIVTLTANPSLDRTVQLADALDPGAVQRATSTRQDPGGKGVNVTRALRASGVESIAVLPAAAGDAFLAALDAEGVPHRAVPIEGAVRTNLTIVDAAGLTTTFLSGGNVTPVDGPVQSSANVDGSTSLVADGPLTAAIRAASDAATDTEWRSATGLVLSELALDAGSARTTVLAMFDRATVPQPARVSALIDEIAGSPWSSLAGLSDAIGAPPESRTTTRPRSQSTKRTGRSGSRACSSMYSVPALVLTLDQIWVSVNRSSPGSPRRWGTRTWPAP